MQTLWYWLFAVQYRHNLGLAAQAYRQYFPAPRIVGWWYLHQLSAPGPAVTEEHLPSLTPAGVGLPLLTKPVGSFSESHHGVFTVPVPLAIFYLFSAGPRSDRRNWGTLKNQHLSQTQSREWSAGAVYGAGRWGDAPRLWQAVSRHLTRYGNECHSACLSLSTAYCQSRLSGKLMASSAILFVLPHPSSRSASLSRSSTQRPPGDLLID